MEPLFMHVSQWWAVGLHRGSFILQPKWLMADCASTLHWEDFSSFWWLYRGHTMGSCWGWASMMQQGVFYKTESHAISVLVMLWYILWSLVRGMFQIRFREPILMLFISDLFYSHPPTHKPTDPSKDGLAKIGHSSAESVIKLSSGASTCQLRWRLLCNG